jgi:hypothetical protein
MALNLSLISSGLIRLLLGRMAGLAEMKKAWSMAQGAWSRRNFGFRIANFGMIKEIKNPPSVRGQKTEIRD